MHNIYFWDTATARLLYKAGLDYIGAGRGVTNGALAAVLRLTAPKSLEIANLSTGQVLGKIQADGSIGHFEFDASGANLLVQTKASVTIYSAETREVLTTTLIEPSQPGSLYLSPDQGRLFSVDNGTLKLFDIATHTDLGTATGFYERAWQVAVSSLAQRLATARGLYWTQDVSLEFWDLAALQLLHSRGSPDFNQTIADLFFTADESQLVSLAAEEDVLKFWDPQTGELLDEWRAESAIQGAAFSANGKLLVTGHWGSVQLWSWPEKTPLGSFYLDSIVDNVTADAAGARVAACDYGILTVWDVAAQQELWTKFDGQLSGVALSPDGTRLAVISGNKPVHLTLYDAATGASLKVYNLKADEDAARVTFSPDGQLLVLSAYAAGLLFFDPQSGALLQTLDYNVSDFSFSADGRLIATASSDGTVRLLGVAP
jgi:WD40 repeat protein